MSLCFPKKVRPFATALPYFPGRLFLMLPRSQSSFFPKNALRRICDISLERFTTSGAGNTPAEMRNIRNSALCLSRFCMVPARSPLRRACLFPTSRNTKPSPGAWKRGMVWDRSCLPPAIRPLTPWWKNSAIFRRGPSWIIHQILFSGAYFPAVPLLGTGKPSAKDRA